MMDETSKYICIANSLESVGEMFLITYSGIFFLSCNDVLSSKQELFCLAHTNNGIIIKTKVRPMLSGTHQKLY